MITNISYNVLIERFRAFAEGHFLIRGFTHGDPSNVNIEKGVEFPWMHVFPVEVAPQSGSRLYTFIITFADLPRDKETPPEYQREMLSDCIRLAEDLLAEIQNGLTLFGPNVEIDGGANIECFINEFSHTLTGVNLSLTLSVPWNWSACDIPADWSVGGSGSGGTGGGNLGVILETNGVLNGDQTLLNLQQGTNVTIVDNGNGTVTINSAGGGGSGTVTSVAIQLPTPANAAYSVSGSPITSSGTFSIAANGTSLQYIDGTGALQTFPAIPKTLADFIVGTQKGDLIQWNGSAWVVIHGINLDDINDVALTTPSAGQVLVYNGTTWVNQNVAAAQGLQEVITIDNVMTQTNVVDCDTFGFAFDNTTNFGVNSTSKINLNVNANVEIGLDSTGVTMRSDVTDSNEVIVDTNGVTLNSDNGTNATAIGLSPSEMRLRTPNVDDATASAGQILSLVNATTGEVEFITPASGGSVTSVGLSLPAPVNPAFSVSGSPVTTSGTLTISANGTSSQYVDGTGALQTMPTTGIKSATASGIDTYAVTITGVNSYVDGEAYLIRFTNGNTDASTLNINGLGAKALYHNNDGPLIGGDIWDGGEMLCVYNTTLDAFQCIGAAPNSLFAYITNAESTTITKGQAVYAFSGTGNRMTVKLARANTDATSAQTIGVVYSDSIAANQKGIIIIQGYLTGLSLFPTSTWADGDPIYLSPTTAGAFTKTKPLAPNHLVYCGILATASNGNAGRMYVRIQNGYEMDELHDVQSSGAVNNDILYRDTAASLWKPASIPTILGYTPVTNARTISTTSPLSGGGDLTANRTLSIADAVADGATKGAAAFTASDFNSSSGVISIDYANGQKASAAQPGFLSAADWSTFNGKVGTFTMRMAIANVAPADGQIYYIADPTLTLNTNAALYRNVFPFACKLVGASITVLNVTATASNEASTLAFRLNNTTDTVLSNAVVFNGAPLVVNTYSVTGLSVNIAAGDTANIKWTCPTWATNPSAASISVILYFERV